MDRRKETVESPEDDLQLAQLREVFDGFDSTGCGRLSTSELRRLCRGLGLEDMAAAEVERLLDRSGSGESDGRFGFDSFKEAFVTVLSKAMDSTENSTEDENKGDVVAVEDLIGEFLTDISDATSGKTTPASRGPTPTSGKITPISMGATPTSGLVSDAAAASLGDVAEDDDDDVNDSAGKRNRSTSPSKNRKHLQRQTSVFDFLRDFDPLISESAEKETLPQHQDTQDLLQLSPDELAHNTNDSWQHRNPEEVLQPRKTGASPQASDKESTDTNQDSNNTTHSINSKDASSKMQSPELWGAGPSMQSTPLNPKRRSSFWTSTVATSILDEDIDAFDDEDVARDVRLPPLAPSSPKKSRPTVDAPSRPPGSPDFYEGVGEDVDASPRHGSTFDVDDQTKSPEELHLKSIWDELDVGKNGFLTLHELAKVCDHIGMSNMSPSEVKDLFVKLDADGDGAVSFEEFLVGLFAHGGALPAAELREPDSAPAALSSPVKRAVAMKAETRRREEGVTLFSALDRGGGDKSVVEAERVVAFWESIGIRDGEEILASLGVNPSHRVSLPHLSSAILNLLFDVDDDAFQAAGATLLNEVVVGRDNLEQAVLDRAHLESALEDANERSQLLLEENEERNQSLEQQQELEKEELKREWRERLRTREREMEEEKQKTLLETESRLRDLETEIGSLRESNSRLCGEAKENETIVERLKGDAVDAEREAEEARKAAEEWRKRLRCAEEEVEKVLQSKRETENEADRILQNHLQDLNSENKRLHDDIDELTLEIERLKQKNRGFRRRRVSAKSLKSALASDAAKSAAKGPRKTKGQREKRSVMYGDDDSESSTCDSEADVLEPSHPDDRSLTLTTRDSFFTPQNSSLTSRDCGLTPLTKENPNAKTSSVIPVRHEGEGASENEEDDDVDAMTNIGSATKEKLELLKDKNSSLRNENSGLRDENISLKDQNSTLKDENSTVKNENSTLKDENSTLKNENSTLKDENSSIKNENASLKVENAAVKAETETQLAALRLQLGADADDGLRRERKLSLDLEESRDKESRAKEEMELLVDNVAIEKEKRLRCEEEAEELRGALREIESAREDLKRTHLSEIEAKDKKIVILREELESLSERGSDGDATLRTEHRQLKSDRDELLREKEDLERRLGDLNVDHQELKRSRGNLEDLDVLKEAGKRLEAQLAETKEDLVDAQKKLRAAGIEAERRDEIHEALEAELAEARSKLSEATVDRNSVDDLLQDVAQCHSEEKERIILEMREKEEEMKAFIVRKDEEIGWLRSSLESKSFDLKGSEERNDEGLETSLGDLLRLEEEVELKGAEIGEKEKTLQRTLSEISTESEERKRRIESLERNEAELKADLTKFVDRVRELETSLEDVKNDFGAEIEEMERGFAEELKMVKEEHLEELRKLEEMRKEESEKKEESADENEDVENKIEFIQERHEIELRQVEEAYRMEITTLEDYHKNEREHMIEEAQLREDELISKFEDTLRQRLGEQETRLQTLSQQHASEQETLQQNRLQQRLCEQEVLLQKEFATEKQKLVEKHDEIVRDIEEKFGREKVNLAKRLESEYRDDLSVRLEAIESEKQKNRIQRETQTEKIESGDRDDNEEQDSTQGLAEAEEELQRKIQTIEKIEKELEENKKEMEEKKKEMAERIVKERMRLSHEFEIEKEELNESWREKLKMATEDQEEDYKELQSRYEFVSIEKSAMEDEVAKLKSERSRSDGKLQESEERSRELEQKIFALRRDVDELGREKTDVLSKLESVIAENKMTIEKREALEKELREKQVEMESLQEELKTTVQIKDETIDKIQQEYQEFFKTSETDQVNQLLSQPEKSRNQLTRADTTAAKSSETLLQENTALKDKLEQVTMKLLSVTETLAANEAEADRQKSLLRQKLATTIPEDEYEKLRLRLLQTEQQQRKEREEWERKSAESESIFRVQEEKLKRALESSLADRDAVDNQLVKTKALMLKKLENAKENIQKRSKTDLLLKDLYVENAHMMKSLELSEERQHAAERELQQLRDKNRALQRLVGQMSGKGGASRI